MNCEEFEPLLADALGDELSPTDRVAFEEHVARCDACRGEYESARRTLSELRSLPAPRRVSTNDIATVLVPGTTLPLRTRKSGTERSTPSHPAPHRSVIRVLRYAASLLIAFTAGYALHAGLTLSANFPPSPIASERARSGDGVYNVHTLEAAFTRVHLQKPARSDLAKAMIAMVPRR